jgi:glucokinase
MEQYTIGIDVGGTKTAYGLLDGRKQIVRRLTHPSIADCSPEAFFDQIAANIGELTTGIAKENLRGIGVGMPSFILFEEGRIVKTANLVNIHDFPARAYLMGKLGGSRVIIDNDSHTGALAEYRHGAGRGFKNILYCPVSTGISSGIIVNGKIFRGRYGWSGESGHMIVSPGEGILCGCGNRGCLMSWCSGSMIVKHIQRWIDSGEKSSMADMAGPGGITCHHLETAWHEGDPLAIRAIDQMVLYLGIWTYNLYVTLNINCFVFGGGLVKMGRGLSKEGDGRDLLGRMKEIFDGYNKNDMPVYFREAELGDDFGIIGAAELLF